MLRDDGSIALIDFGLAKHVALKMEVTDKGLIFGTPHYMSPEQGHGKPIDGRSDLYALGVMLYEMLTGKKPFDADNHMAILVHHAKAPIPKLPERIESLQPLIDTLMAKDPANRPATAAIAATLIDFALQTRKAAIAAAAAGAATPETTGTVATEVTGTVAAAAPENVPPADPTLELSLAPEPKS
jgi:serine/threonine protein kinase